MIKELHVRPAENRDVDILVQFNLAMARETEGFVLDGNRLRSGVTAVLKDTSKGRYFVLEAEGAIRAALMITEEWSDWRNGMFWWIQSVYVEPAYRQRGFYKKLYSEIKTLKTDQVIGFRLYVDKQNHIGQLTYKHLGMDRTNYELFEELLEGN